MLLAGFPARYQQSRTLRGPEFAPRACRARVVDDVVALAFAFGGVVDQSVVAGVDAGRHCIVDCPPPGRIVQRIPPAALSRRARTVPTRRCLRTTVNQSISFSNRSFYSLKKKKFIQFFFNSFLFIKKKSLFSFFFNFFFIH